MLVLYALVFVLIPAAIIALSHRQRWAAKVGVIVLCYLAGLALGNSGLIPASALGVQQGLSEFTVALALPMLLFTLDVRAWRRVAGKALLSMLIATASVTAIASALFVLFRNGDALATSHLAAMAVGVYTGGTPNLAAIKAGLDIPHAQYLVFYSVDTLVGAFYLMLMLTVGGALFGRLLPVLGEEPGADTASTDTHNRAVDNDDYRPLLQPDARLQLVKIVGLALLVLGASLGIAAALVEWLALEPASALIIVLLTTGGIALSLVPAVRSMQLAYRVGMYLIYVFCFTVASMAKMDDLLRADASVVLFIVSAVFGSVVVHALLCRLAGVDRDTFMVTSVAAVASPPFVPLIARSLGKPALMLTGMTTGIIGYALGNFIGISLGLLLQRL